MHGMDRSPFRLSLNLGAAAPVNNDVEAARGPLQGAQLEPTQPVSGRDAQAANATPSPRQNASLLSGTLERLSGLGSYLPNPMNLIRGREQNNGMLPSHRQDIELQNNPQHRLPEDNHSRRAQDEEMGLLNSEHMDPYSRKENELSKEVKEVLADTFNWQKAGKKASVALARGAAAGATIYGSYSLVDYMIQSKVPAEQQALSRGFIAMGMLVPVYQESKELVNGLREAMTSESKLSYAEALEKTHLRRKAESAEILKTMPRDIQDACDKIDLALQQAFAAARRGDKVKFALIRGMMHWRKDFMLGRPLKTKEVEPLKTPQGRENLMRDMEQSMRLYKMPLKDKLSGFALGVGVRSLEHEIPDHLRAPADFDVAKLDLEDNWHQWNKVPKVLKQMMLMAGLPGTGKTHFVETVLPRLLKLPVAGLIMPDKQAGGVNSMMAKEWSALEQEEYVTADTDAMGKIGLKLIRAGCTNPILFLDEADLDDMDGIKRLTDPSRDHLEATALETLINFANVTIMLGVNALKKAQGAPEGDSLGELDGGVEDRVELAIFDGSERQSKWEKAIEAYHGWAGLYCLPIKGGEGAILDEGQQNRMQDLFKHSLQHLVDTHHDKAKVPGSRMQVPVASVTNYIAYRLMKEQTLGGEPITQQDVDNYIDDFYAPRIKNRNVQSAPPTDAELAARRSQRQSVASNASTLEAVRQFYINEADEEDEDEDIPYASSSNFRNERRQTPEEQRHQQMQQNALDRANQAFNDAIGSGDREQIAQAEAQLNNVTYGIQYR
ncbi:hypothetical protein ACKC9G_16900 [Pokkaliibacter sp. CJK22405]|uniref:hypothetical protein n=1 Tax=Pokkaliibacter sp. CJK22405 TaxID=3384615 RepID=UPI003985606B